MKRFLTLFLSAIMPVTLSLLSCKAETVPETIEVEKIVTVTKYICPRCSKEYDTVGNAKNCCGAEVITNTVTKYVCTECNKEYATRVEALNCHKDAIAPARVTNLKAVNLNSAVELTWTDPKVSDLYGIEITYTKTSSSRAIAPMVKDSIMVAPGTQFAKITGLTNGTTYIFTVKAVDTSGNKSTASTINFTPALIEGEPMAITLMPSTSAKTNQNVTVTADIKTSSAIKTVKYASGEKPVSYFENEGTRLTSSPYTFEVSENGNYTLYALDVDGRRETSFIEIDNIDKTPPFKASNFLATYSALNKKIILSWTNPGDSDFAGLTLSYGKAGETVREVEFSKTVNSYEITDIEADNAQYSVSLVTKDDASNVSESNTISVLAASGPVVNAITLNRTHLDSIMNNRNIEVSIAGSNFNELTSLLVQVTDGTTAQSPVTATIDAVNNTATATVTAPKPSSPTDTGTKYTVKAIVNGQPQTDVLAEFTVSKAARVTSINLEKSQIRLASQEKVRAIIKGYNFDIRGVTKICLFDSNGSEITECSQTVALEANTSDKEFTADITLPAISGIYTVVLYFDEVKESKTSSLQVYEDATITSVILPKAGTSYGGNMIPVTIRGKNFTSPEVIVSNFSGTNGITNFKIVNDTTATAEIACPYVAGETSLTVNCASASATALMIVKDYSVEYQTGDLLLSDGSFVKYSSHTGENPTFTDEQKTKAVGVLIGLNKYGIPLILGLKRSGNRLEWAASGTIGYNTSFINIQCIPSKTGLHTATTAEFSYDTDGSDNWEYVKSIDPEGTANAEINYPAFNYAVNYGTINSLPEGYQDGWYLPSIAELADIYRKEYVLNKVLTALGSENATPIGMWNSAVYASSSQYSFGYSYVWTINFYYGGSGANSIDRTQKNNSNYVLVIRTFND